MHIIYHIAGGTTYARLAESYREGGLVKKRTTNLGKVIDKDKGIYQNRQRGIYQFDISTMQYKDVSPHEFPDAVDKDVPLKEKLILDFGDTYLLDQFLADSGLKAAINAAACKNRDTLYAMLCYYVLCVAANCHASSWYEGNYARIIYPDAKMSSQRISEFLSEIGNEPVYREFFAEYLRYFTHHTHGVSFITRLKENRKVYKELLAEHLGTKENFVRYNERFAYIKRVKCELIAGYTSYAYIGLDIAGKGSESKKLFKSAKARKLTDGEVYDLMAAQGVFILVSSRPIARDKILPTYYTRQNVEQIFDIGKNYADMLPLRIQNEDTFRGHLLLTFIATVVVKLMQDRLLDSPYNPISMFMNLRNLKCKIYSDRIITGEPFKKANDCFKLFHIKCPSELMLK